MTRIDPPRGKLLRHFVPLVLGAALTLALVAAVTGRGGVFPAGDEGAVSDDGGSGGSHRDLAETFTNIFVGTVVEVTRTEELPTSSPNHTVPITYYAVDVEETLKGDIAGRIEVKVSEEDTAEAAALGPIRSGQRYLFAAGPRSPSGYYPVTAGISNIPIANDRQRAELVAEFRRLIANAPSDQQRRSAVSAAEQEERVGAPTLRVEPARAMPGDEVLVSGQNLVLPEVSIWWDGTKTRLATGRVAPDNSIEERVTVPRDAKPGTHTTMVLDGRGERAEAKLEVMEP